MKSNFTLLLILILISHFAGFAQMQSSLFVHYDKTVYTENEVAWFTAYMLKSEVDIKQHTTLSVALIKDDNRNIVIEERFLMERGLSFGNITLPDSIAPGDYHFVAYTNMMKDSIPLAAYRQPITIKTIADQTFEATLKVLDTASTPGEIQVQLNTRNAVFQKIPGALITYSIGRQKAISAKTNKQGQYLFVIPRKQVSSSDNTLVVQVKHGNESKNISLKLPFERIKVKAGFYPEGGNLLTGKVNKVGWEVKTSDGLPLSVSGILLEDNTAIDTINTSAYGIGVFKFIPQKGKNYHVQLTDMPKDIEAGTMFNLPQALDAGIVMNAYHAVANDTLVLRIQASRPQRVQMKVYNEHKVFIDVSLHLTVAVRVIKVALEDFPRGLATVTILDPLNKPLSERLFFAHYDQQPKLHISTDAVYKPRQKVHLKLNLEKMGSVTDSIKGLVSIACVQSNRLEILKQSNIERYFDFEQNLPGVPVNPMGSLDNNIKYLEDVLLVKGWRRYIWKNMEDSVGENPVRYNSAIFKGYVNRLGKPVKKPVALSILANRSVGYFEGDSTGYFEFKPTDLLVEDNKKVYVFISDKASELFDFKFYDPYKAVNHYYAETDYRGPSKPMMYEQSSDINVIKGSEKVIKLEEVVIKASNDESMHGSAGYGANACGDYVCQYNILNCSNHSFGKPPVKGTRYMTSWGGAMIYPGCSADSEKEKNSVIIKGINVHKEFYGSDYEVYNPGEGEYFSTIYWKHSFPVNEKESEVSFYTSDVTGKFKVIVQGLTTVGVIYGEHEFTVQK